MILVRVRAAFFRTVAHRVVAAIACGAGGLATPITPLIAYCGEPEKADTQPSKVLVEVAKLFHTAKQPADLRQIQRLLQGCVDAHDYDEGYDNQASGYYEALSRFCKYVDEHRLEQSDLNALRVWAADSRDLDVDPSRQDGGIAGERPGEPTGFSLANKIGMVNSTVWGMVKNKFGECRPRHAVLLSVLSPVHVYMPVMRSCVFSLHEKLGKPKDQGADLNDVEKFFMERAHVALRVAVREEQQAVLKAYAVPSYRQFGEFSQKCLEHKSNPREFKLNLREFCRHFETVLKLVPDYAIEDRYDLAQFLRAVWNMVHAYGDNEDQQDLRTFVIGLRDYFSERSDSVTVKWLNQVMAKAGKPPAVLMETVTLVPIESPKK